MMFLAGQVLFCKMARIFSPENLLNGVFFKR
jgi:hypothetical protein